MAHKSEAYDDLFPDWSSSAKINSEEDVKDKPLKEAHVQSITTENKRPGKIYHGDENEANASSSNEAAVIETKGKTTYLNEKNTEKLYKEDVSTSSSNSSGDTEKGHPRRKSCKKEVSEGSVFDPSENVWEAIPSIEEKVETEDNKIMQTDKKHDVILPTSLNSTTLHSNIELIDDKNNAKLKSNDQRHSKEQSSIMISIQNSMASHESVNISDTKRNENLPQNEFDENKRNYGNDVDPLWDAWSHTAIDSFGTLPIVSNAASLKDSEMKNLHEEDSIVENRRSSSFDDTHYYSTTGLDEQSTNLEPPTSRKLSTGKDEVEPWRNPFSEEGFLQVRRENYNTSKSILYEGEGEGDDFGEFIAGQDESPTLATSVYIHHLPLQQKENTTKIIARPLPPPPTFQTNNKTSKLSGFWKKTSEKIFKKFSASPTLASESTKKLEGSSMEETPKGGDSLHYNKIGIVSIGIAKPNEIKKKNTAYIFKDSHPSSSSHSPSISELSSSEPTKTNKNFATFSEKRSDLMDDHSQSHHETKAKNQDIASKEVEAVNDEKLKFQFIKPMLEAIVFNKDKTEEALSNLQKTNPPDLKSKNETSMSLNKVFFDPVFDFDQLMSHHKGSLSSASSTKPVNRTRVAFVEEFDPFNTEKVDHHKGMVKERFQTTTANSGIKEPLPSYQSLIPKGSTNTTSIQKASNNQTKNQPKSASNQISPVEMLSQDSSYTGYELGKSTKVEDEFGEWTDHSNVNDHPGYPNLTLKNPIKKASVALDKPKPANLPSVTVKANISNGSSLSYGADQTAQNYPSNEIQSNLHQRKASLNIVTVSKPSVTSPIYSTTSNANQVKHASRPSMQAVLSPIPAAGSKANPKLPTTTTHQQQQQHPYRIHERPQAQQRRVSATAPPPLITQIPSEIKKPAKPPPLPTMGNILKPSLPKKIKDPPLV